MFLLVFDKFFSPTVTVIIISLIIIALFVAMVFKKKMLLKEKSHAKVIVNTIINLVLVTGAGVAILHILDFDFASTFSLTKFLDFFNEQIGRILASIVTIIVSFGLFNLIKSAMGQVVKREGPFKKRRQTIYKVTISFSRYILYVVVIAILLGVWGIDITPILAGLGIAGLVIGLGAQRLITDFISGLFIIFEHHFDVGDVVEVNGFKGQVVDIGLKTTRIKNWRNEVLIIANGNISEVKNFSLNNSVAYVEFTIPYRNNLNEVIKILEEKLPIELKDNPSVLEPPVVRGVTNLGEKGASIGIAIITKTEEHYGVQRATQLKVKEILSTHNIEMDLPQVIVKKENE